MKLTLTGLALALIATSVASRAADSENRASSVLAGTWTLVAADVIHADGSRTTDYGKAPKGLLMIDAQGHYSLQIVSAERPRFALEDKAKGTAREYEAAILGASTHFGTIQVDVASSTFTLQVQGSTFPNWEGRPQKRHYELKAGELTYRVAPRPDGSVPISVWRRLN